MRTPVTLPLLFAGVLAGFGFTQGCGQAPGESGFSGDGRPGGGGAPGSSSGGGGSGVPGTFGTTDASAPGPCKGLQCQQVACSGGTSTTVSGTVFDPSGNNPLYNVAVYVPNDTLGPITHGATCDKCGATLSGSPIVTALTDTAGKFTLKNVPVGDKIPLVIQVGKWRRQVTIPHVEKCKDTALADKNLTRLPRNAGEGDLPLIALATGGADELECLFRSTKIGLDDSEFSAGQGAGHIHLYKGVNGSTALTSGAPIPDAQPFWSDPTQLAKYDIVLLSCEGGGEHLENKPPQAIRAMHDYASAGGRIFASHWHEGWFRVGFPEVASFNPNDNSGANGVTPTTVDTSFPKGAALQQWLGNVGALSPNGTLPVLQAKYNLTSVHPPAAQTWISAGGSQPEYMSFNTPTNVPADQACGRAVYSNLHVSAGDRAGRDFPSGCTTTGLSPQEKALEFMLFDLSACVQPDGTPPVVPPPTPR